MKYAILIYQNAQDTAACGTDPERAQDWPRYSKLLKEAGVPVDGIPLQTPANATRLSFRNGERLVQDGPYADTKEQLGGLIIIDVPDLDTAISWAARIPHSAERVYEIRPVGTLPS